MENYNMTVKNALIFIEGVEKLKKINPTGLKEIRDYMELQILKNEFIENISKYNNLKNLKILNGMLKIMIDDENKKSVMEQVQEIEMKIYKNMLDNDVI